MHVKFMYKRFNIRGCITLVSRTLEHNYKQFELSRQLRNHETSLELLFV